VAINLRQFGGVRPQAGLGLVVDGEFLPDDVAPCTDTYCSQLSLDVGERPIQLFHALGETDDHTWAWIPHRRAVVTGDFFTWVFPNAGNPQKVQRYPLEWAQALRAMVALEPELLLPAHALPVAGTHRIRTVLETVAGVLEQIVSEVINAMNAGASLDEILHTVRVDPDLLALPYLRPVYDEPEFVVRNVWRLYGGWWDGNPAHLKPPSDASVGTAIAALAGGVARLTEAAEAAAEAGDHRLACQLIEFAAAAEPQNAAACDARTRIYSLRRKAERSLMAKGIFADAARRSSSPAAEHTSTPIASSRPG
jgi:alkyl sulfatase BDS1-like metallo-beta-lactamase superfamily hydrolase